MSRIASNVRQMAAPSDYPRLLMMAVLGVGDDDKTVVLDAGNGKPVVTPCLRAYGGRGTGDQVLVAQLSRKNWIVIGAPGQVIGDYLTAAQVTAMIANAVSPPGSSVSYGSGPPTGSGWQQATVLPWVRDDGAGGRSTYFQIGAEQPPPSTHTVTPSPVTISPNSHGSYRTDGETDQGIIQGDWEGLPWTGAMFYGTQIADACAGKTVASMSITLSRLDDDSGWNRGVDVHVGTHGQKTKAKVINLANVHTLGTLAHGQKKTFDLPAAIVSALKSGSDWGVGMGETSDYVKFTTGSGAIKIIFS